MQIKIAKDKIMLKLKLERENLTQDKISNQKRIMKKERTKFPQPKKKHHLQNIKNKRKK
jgi:hypothetical protein